MDALQELEVLSLISKLTTEIRNNTGINDKSLAEFILDLHEKSIVSAEDGQSKTQLNTFKRTLEEMGAEFPEGFIENINRLIWQMHPKHKNKKLKPDTTTTTAIETSSEDLKETGDDQYQRPINEKERLFKGLSLPDNPQHVKAVEQQAEEERVTKPDSRDRGRSRSPRQRDREAPWRNNNGYRYREREHKELLTEPELGKIYQAKIRNMTTYGAFATLQGFKTKIDGLIHISKIAEGTRINSPSDVLERDQIVKVKVNDINGHRISLSMKDVDQETGEETHHKKIYDDPVVSTGANAIPTSKEEQQRLKKKNPKRRLTSPERWEIRQLIASGAISAKDYPELVDDGNTNLDMEENVDEMDEEVDIEVKDEEPPFLAGQTKQSLELSPIRVVKAPDGSMNRAAMNGATLAKDRKETRQKELREKEMQQKEASKSQKEDIGIDPLKESSSGHAPSPMGPVTAPGDLPEWKKATAGRNISYGKRTTLSISEQKKSLPVYSLKTQLLQAIHDNQILVVVGDTGSGKTTQITQYLDEAGYTFNDTKKIGCTQPRRVAAESVAKRVAEEYGCPVGEEVGYLIRFEDYTSDRTRIKYMTDGMLQREALMDPDMSQYSVIMLDEAHERTIATDVLFALLKNAAKRRPDLKLIITSATLDAEKFSEYFLECPIVFIPGKTYPVDILYTKEPEMDYLEASLMTVMQIHLSEPPGDILLFLTGQEEIDTSCETLYNKMKALGPDVPELIILPVYSALPGEMQSRIFEPAPEGSRKVVIATNIAETSITIDGIYYVIDPGFVKINAYDPKLGMDSLVISPISQAQANQRAGRAGRTGPGKCYRLYTESAYENEMLPNTVPEIQRQNLAHTILMLKAMGINDLLHFDFMDPPPSNTMLMALEELYQLSALDGEGLLTRLGRKMADFPMEPAMAKVLIASVEHKCSEEILSVVAMLSVQSVFFRPREKQEQADKKKSKFHDPHGDHLTYLNVYNGWIKSGRSKSWCTENFIQERSMRRAAEVRKQLVQIMTRYKHRVISSGGDSDIVRKVLCSGYFRNAARKDPQEGYKTLLEGTTVSLHPSSALWGKPAEYVIYHTLLLTAKEYMQITTVIDPKWLVEAAPTFYKASDPREGLSKRKKNEKVTPLFNRHASDQNEWRLSALKKGSKSSSTFG